MKIHSSLLRAYKIIKITNAELVGGSLYTYYYLIVLFKAIISVFPLKTLFVFTGFTQDENCYFT